MNDTVWLCQGFFSAGIRNYAICAQEQFFRECILLKIKAKKINTQHEVICECIKFCGDLRFSKYVTNIRINPYFVTFPVKYCDSPRIECIKYILWCLNSHCSFVFFNSLLGHLCRYSNALNVPNNSSVQLCRSKLAHILDCREMWKMKSFRCSLLWYCKLLQPAHMHTLFHPYNIYYTVYTHVLDRVEAFLSLLKPGCYSELLQLCTSSLSN